jgi:hypothetical protein
MLAIGLGTGTSVYAAAPVKPAKPVAKAKPAPKPTPNATTGRRTVKQEFKRAGESKHNYAASGHAAARGGKNLGEMGKQIGLGTAKVGASVGRGIGRIFS